MKIHTKKRAFRAACKRAAQAGLINRADGSWINRSQATANSMQRDYYPQSGGGGK